MMWVIAILIIILTLSILKDTHVEVYYRYCSSTRIALGLLPIANIILFTAFIIYYAIHAGWNPNECEGYTHVFSLRGENIVIRGLLKVKNLLCKRV